jgi:DNA (cytosine-5)-methyltransferase 1
MAFDGYSFSKIDVDGASFDWFAGGGGWSTGAEMATGESPAFAGNHDPAAIAMHSANHPRTAHFCESVWTTDVERFRGMRIAYAVFSPDCKHFSKAKGGKPVEKGIRGLAWFVHKFARICAPRVIFLENVEEFADWGPLDDDGQPIAKRMGETFRKWWRGLERLGYRLEMRELSAHDYGAPTIRKRLFIIGRRDDLPIVWPEPTHGPGRAHPHRVAAECIDWSLPILSIFASHKRAVKWAREWRKAGVQMGTPKRPLKVPTRRRIARGVLRFVIDDADPFLIPVLHAGDDRVRSIHDPMWTVTAAHRGEHAVVMPFFAPTLIQTGYGEREGQAPRCLNIREPLGTIVGCGQRHAMVAAFLARHNGERQGGFVGAASMSEGMPTLTARNNKAVVAASLVELRGSTADHAGARSVRDQVPTLTAQGNHVGAVAAFLTRYNGVGIGSRAQEPMGTVTARDRFGVVVVRVQGVPYAIADIGMRMLAPRELFRAQGFPDTYLIGDGAGGLRLTKEEQVRMVGNSVCPPLAAALIAANVPRVGIQQEVAA